MGVPVSAMRVSAWSLLDRFCLLGSRVLDGLRFVEHDQSPRCGIQPGRARQKAVARDYQVDICQIGRTSALSFSAGAADGWAIDRFQARRESGNLRRPVGEQRGRGYEQARFPICACPRS